MRGLLRSFASAFRRNGNTPAPSAKTPAKPSAHKPTAKPRSLAQTFRSHLSVVPRFLDEGQPVFSPKSTHRPRHLRRKSNRRKAALKAKARNRRRRTS